jgi:acetyl/propionyl-CoA carboxylase alpha subunit
VRVFKKILIANRVARLLMRQSGVPIVPGYEGSIIYRPRSPHAGRVAKVLIRQGQAVDRGQALNE